MSQGKMRESQEEQQRNKSWENRNWQEIFKTYVGLAEQFKCIENFVMETGGMETIWKKESEELIIQETSMGFLVF